MKTWILRFLVFSLIVFEVSCKKNEITAYEGQNFETQVVDANAPKSPWGKGAGDIDGDGLPDLLIGGHMFQSKSIWRRLIWKLGIGEKPEISGSLVWYKNPTWKKNLISENHFFRTDLEVADIDNDDHKDVISVTDDGLIWFKNPSWQETYISKRKLHDIEVADLDGDGDLDLVARNQSLFGYDNGDSLFLFENVDSLFWKEYVLAAPSGEGLKVFDINGDGRQDIIVNKIWFKNPGTFHISDWTQQVYAEKWDWDDVFVDVGDINGDGMPDIACTPSEKAGQKYRISWFEAPKTPGKNWIEHIVDSSVEADYHALVLQDFDSDGNLDLATAEMNQGKDPDEVVVYFNQDSTRSWRKETISHRGSHSFRGLDIDRDFDVDIFGADWEMETPVQGYAATIWRNQTSKPTKWKRHVIDAHRPNQAVFVDAADLDGDGYSDVLSGPVWYRNPGSFNGKWERKNLGQGAENFIITKDLDNDGDIDFIASGWSGYNWTPPPIHKRILHKLGFISPPLPSNGSRLQWGENNGKGQFLLHEFSNQGKGDFPQGIGFGHFEQDNKFLISWHKTGLGIQSFSIPDPPSNIWKSDIISPFSQDEALSIVDVDRDGDDDIVTGTYWLEKNENNWIKHVINSTSSLPDRHSVIDMNGDGRLDVVVGYEAISKVGALAWYEQGENAKDPWTQHIIDHVIGPMSLDVADMDGDGDIDIVVGEHNLSHPENARLAIYKNLGGGKSWRGEVVYIGDEHHDGARLSDIDGDGDLDILSIGWGHSQVLIYENPGSTK